MSKDKISDYSATANSNTDIGGINIDEGCAPSGINDAIRTLMKQLKDFQQGTNSDPFNGPHNGTVGATTPAAGAFTTLSASSTLSVTGAGTIQGLTVGKGAGAVSSNTALGNGAFATNSSGVNNTALGYSVLNLATSNNNTAVGYSAMSATSTGVENASLGAFCLLSNTTGSYNVAVGKQALYSNTTASNNTAVGYQAGYSNTTALNITALGYQAGYSHTTSGDSTFIGRRAGYVSTGNACTFLGESSGVAATTGAANTFIGASSGYLVTTGAKNVILGSYSGNNGGLDIRTASNYIVLSDGDGNPRMYNNGSPLWLHPYSNGYGILSTTGTYFGFSFGASNNGFNTASYGGASTADCVLRIGKDASTNRSINAGGTINASGADYAEYMVKAGNFTIAKGDVVGINADGKLTNVFADAVSFVVKSTDPSYVGGDTWGRGDDVGTIPEKPTEGATAEELSAWEVAYAAFEVRREAARATVDRIAFAGQVPVNVTGATAGQFIVPTNDNGAIIGVAVNEADMTLAQYMKAIGKVIAIEQDGRAKIIVKVA